MHIQLIWCVFIRYGWDANLAFHWFGKTRLSGKQNMLPESRSWSPEYSLSTQITQQGFDAERRDLLKHFMYFSYALDCFTLTWYVCAALNLLYPLSRTHSSFLFFCRFFSRCVPTDFATKGIRNSNPPLKPVRPRRCHPLTITPRQGRSLSKNRASVADQQSS